MQGGFELSVASTHWDHRVYQAHARGKAYTALFIRAPEEDRVQLVLSVDNMNTSVSGRESLNGAAEPGRDLLKIDVFDGAKSVRTKNRCDASRLETADRTFTNFLKLFGPLRF